MGMQKVRARQRGTRQSTLDMEHSSTVAKLNAARMTLEEKTTRYKEVVKKVREMEAMPRASLSDEELDTLFALKDTMRGMEAEVEQARSACDEVEYYLKAGDILFKYYDIMDKGGSVVTSHGGDAHDSRTNPGASSSSMDRVASSSLSSLSSTAVKTQNMNSIMRFFSASPADACPDPRADQDDDAQQQQHQPPLPGSPMYRTSCSGKRYGITSTTMNKSRQSTTADDRATLLEKYLACTNTDFIKSDAPEDEAAIENAAASLPTPCAHCGSTNRTVMTHDGYIFCNECFTLEYVLVDHEKPSYKDPPKEVTYFAYKRINHFNEWLNQVQGKETTDIPVEVYDKILLEIKKQKIYNMADLTNTKVREILKKLKINKYYEHIPHIINRLSGVSMPHIPPELEDRLRHMFCQIQVPFLKHSPPSRKNFLSYSYVLHKFMQLLEKDQYVNCFTLLKSRDKLQTQDIIWSKICEELGWEFVRSL